jgi:cobalt/nickel transport system permease protein
MHLGQQAITTECAILGLLGSAVTMGLTYRFARESKAPSPLTVAALGSLVFAAQMLNLPVGSHSSAHWVGGCALTYLFGPFLAMQTMGIVLLLQALLLGDGALSAWGVNLFNMGIVPALLTSAIVRMQGRNLFSLAAASVAAILVAAMLIPCEIAVGRSSEQLQTWQNFFAAMVSFHALAAVLEALLSCLAVVAWQQLNQFTTAGETISAQRKSLVVCSLALILAGAASVFSSVLPDGYEAAASSAMQWLEQSPQPHEA